jgi:hypothetical protein
VLALIATLVKNYPFSLETGASFADYYGKLCMYKPAQRRAEIKKLFEDPKVIPEELKGMDKDFDKNR